MPLNNLDEILSKSLHPQKENFGDEDEIEYGYKGIDIQIKKEQLRRIELENNAIEGENKGDAQDREQRKDFAERIFQFVCNYMIFVFMVLFLKAITPRFYLSDNVIITLLGTTTANVIGILIIVVTYLFSRKRK